MNAARTVPIAVVVAIAITLPTTILCANWCPMDSMGVVETALKSAGTDTVTYKFIYVAFPNGPSDDLTASMLDSVPNAIAQFVTRQSRGALQVIPEVILNLDNPGHMWMADSVASKYRSWATVPRNRISYWGTPPLADSTFAYMGALQAEMLFKVFYSYINPPRSLPNPLTGTDAAIIILNDGQGLASPLGTWIDGYGYLQVIRDIGTALRGMAAYRLNGINLVAGVTANWALPWLVKFRIAHELGHHLGNLSHSPVSSSWAYGLDTYWYGNYSCMRAEDIPRQGCLPYSLLDLVNLYPAEAGNAGSGWYPNPIPVTDNLKSTVVYDVRDRTHDNPIYKINIDPWRAITAEGDTLQIPQYFLIAFHSGIAEDAELNRANRPLYQSSGLEVWHICAKSCSYSYWDLESAVGRYTDPGPFQAGYWEHASPDSGYDNLDNYPSQGDTNGLRNYCAYQSYAGSRFDFFRAARDSFAKDEFSFRSNPSTFGREPYVVGVTQYMRRLPETVPNSVMVKIREDHGDYLVVDFLLAPYEDIESPNGGEEIVVGQPSMIRWDVDVTLDITSVDIELSIDGGASYTETIATSVNNSGEYVWVPTEDHITTNGRIRLTYHNSNSTRTCDDESDGVFSVQVWPVEYQNMSSSTGLDYEGSPYSSVTLDYDSDGKNDLFVSIREESGRLYQLQRVGTNGVPEFEDRTDLHIANDCQPQAGLRGIVAGDYDNNGHVDIFAAADTLARLYHNNGGTFADSASVRGLSSLSSHSWAGAWGDYDRDGQLDLYVCRAQGATQDPTPTNVTALKGRLLRNDMRTNRMFVDATDSSGIGTTAMNAAIAASWADIDGDNDLDLFVGDLRIYGASPICRMYVNADDGTFQEVLADRFTGTNLEGISSVAWSDMNNDGNLDLILGSHLQDPMVFLNNGTGDFDGDAPLTAEIDGEANDVRPVDHDLDSRVDLIVLPRAETSHPHLFSNRVPTQDIELLDESYQVGLAASSGRVDGIAAADFNHDGDKDIYLGRPVISEKYFYRARTSSGDAPNADWVGAKLIAGPGNNASAIGAKVKFTIGTTFQQLQVVDGGSGRGGQADSTLICGLGNLMGTVQAVVKWPGGYEQTVTLARNQVTTITDATTPTLTGSVRGTYVALPGAKADWVFTWNTSYSCDPALDKVTITDRSNPPQCETLGTVVLTPSSYGVEHSVRAKSGGGYRHTMKWLDRDCIPPCGYNFTVESATDSSHKSTSTTRQISVGVCVQ